jgi:hypothetical protein
MIRGAARRRRWAWLVAGVMLAAVSAWALPEPVVPRDEPEPLPDGAVIPAPDELPDYGPVPLAEPAQSPEAAASKVAPLVIPYTPRFKLTYARFTGHKIGGRDQPFNLAGFTLYLVSGWLRVGATTRFGLEDGVAGEPRDFFLDEVFSAGLQASGWSRRILPFVELNGGLGFRMYYSFNNSFPCFQWSVGVDVGAELYVAGRFYFTGALGWLRPVVRLQTPVADSIYSDTFIFKVGLGI